MLSEVLNNKLTIQASEMFQRIKIKIKISPLKKRSVHRYVKKMLKNYKTNTFWDMKTKTNVK